MSNSVSVPKLVSVEPNWTLWQGYFRWLKLNEKLKLPIQLSSSAYPIQGCRGAGAYPSRVTLQFNSFRKICYHSLADEAFLHIFIVTSHVYFESVAFNWFVLRFYFLYLCTLTDVISSIYPQCPQVNYKTNKNETKSKHFQKLN